MDQKQTSNPSVTKYRGGHALWAHVPDGTTPTELESAP